MQAVHALAAILLNLSHSLPEDPGQALAFASARAGIALFEPRVAIARIEREISAGDALEFELFVPVECADRAGVEIVFADGRRSVAPRTGATGSWHHVRVALDEFTGATTRRFELVARGALAAEIGYRVDEVVITNPGAEPLVIFGDTLPAGPRILRDDLRQAGAALVDSTAEFDGMRTVWNAATVSEPWHAYDLSNLRRAGDGIAEDALAPRGKLLVGPCVPLSFAAAGERTSIAAAGQRFAFEPLEGGRFYTVWLALSTADGRALSTRMQAYGTAGERCTITLVLPAARDIQDASTDLGSCRLVEATFAADFPLSGIELPDVPGLRVHAITFQWRKDGYNNSAFQGAWLRQEARVSREMPPKRAAQLARYVADCEIGAVFSDHACGAEIQRDLFTGLLRPDGRTFEALLDAASERHAAAAVPLRGLQVTIQDVRDDRERVRVESDMDPETLLYGFTSLAGKGAPRLDGDLACMPQVPQIMAALGRDAALLSEGPSFGRWSSVADSSVVVAAPFAVLRDTREFADLAWREWARGVADGSASPEILIAVDGEARRRGAAEAIANAFQSITLAPRVRVETADRFLVETKERFGAGAPIFVPRAMRPIAEERRIRIAEHVPKRRRAATAIALLATLATPPSMDGSVYPTTEIDALRKSLYYWNDEGSGADADSIVARAEALLATELGIVARSASTVGKGTPIVAFNSIPWARRALVQLNSNSATLLASDGTNLPWQPTYSGGRVFAVEVPALGYHVLRGLTGDNSASSKPQGSVTVDDWTARNEDIAFTIDPTTGALASLVLAEGQHEMLAEPAQFVAGDWRVERAEFIERGPLRAIARVMLTSGARRAEVDFVLTLRSPLLEVRTRIDGESVADPIAWRVKGRHTAPRMLFGVPLGSAVAAPLADGTPARHRVGDWAVSTSGLYGISILAGDLATVLVGTDHFALELSSSTSRFALMPFGSGWSKAAPAARAVEFAQAIQLVATDVHEGARPARHSFVKIARRLDINRMADGPECGVTLTAFESAPDGATAILRLAETQGSQVQIVLWLDRPIFGAERVDLRGRALGPLRVENSRIEFGIGAHRIETIRVALRP
ncbi:MAG: hypothetical protein JNL28_16395 [Planctomycetes bacterium]|nr:hypothetical protein [Planctomycetota bacterium]